MRKLFVLGLVALLLNSACAILFLPAKQKVTISSSTKDGKIYVNNDLEGTGTATFKTKKVGAKQVVIQTPGYKDNYLVLSPTRRQPGFYVCVAGDALFIPVFYGIYAMVFDFKMPKGHAYDKSTKFNVTGKIITKTDADKFIHISKISADLKKDDDVKEYDVVVKKGSSKKLDKLMEEAETKKKQKEDKEKERKLSKKDKEKLKEQEEDMKYDDTKFSYNIYKTLKNSGFVDTVNKVFQDENNTLVLEGKITRINFYRIIGGNKTNFLWNQYYRSKVYITWYLKNRYGETLDSINAKDMSGEFVLYNWGTISTHSDNNQQKQVEKMIGDAIDNSYLNLYNSSVFKKYIKAYNPLDAAIADEQLKLKKPSAVVTSKSDASVASVIIKRDDKGHGSGFAITQDGYILTNYHVIASKDPHKATKITVLTSSGEELEAKIVRFNKNRDVALLKVDKSFDKAFALSSEKQFKNLLDVYTIGAPKSIELGQTVTSGIISNERNSNNNELLQLSMPINFGNSGGPIFDNSGVLHGVVVSKLVGESTEGISFAIPAYKIDSYLNVSY